MTIQWNKSEEGYVTSKCGRFEIEPVWMGRTTPQAYDLYLRSEPTAPRERVNRYCDTQRDAKEIANRISSETRQ